MSTATDSPLLLVRTAGLPFARIEALAADWRHCEAAIREAQSDLTAGETALSAAFDVALADLLPGDLRTVVYNARRDFFRRSRLPAPAFAAQFEPAIPALVQAVRALEQARQALQTAREAFAGQYEKTLVTGYAHLQALAAEPELQRALLFASHDLLAQLSHFLEKKPEEFAKKERQTALAVLQFATRMATRTVPLSRFATVSLTRVDDNREADTDPVPVFEKSVVSPNVALLEALYTVLLREPIFYRSLPLMLNPCVVEQAETTYRWLYFDGAQESFQEAPAEPLLGHVVGIFLENNRRMPFSALLKNLAEAVEAAPAELEAYLLELADTGFLEWALPEPGLSPDWCGGLYRYLGFLPAEPIVVETAALLQTLRTTARVLPYMHVQEAARAQCAAGDQVRDYFLQRAMPAPLLPPEQLFYEDVERPAEVGIPPDALRGLLDQLASATRQSDNYQIRPPRLALSVFFSKISPEGKPVGFLEFARGFMESQNEASLSAGGEALVEGVSVGARQPHPQPLPRGGGGHAHEKGANLDSGSQSTPNRDQPSMRDVPPSPPGEGLGLARAGALFQVFQQNGQWHAVANALYPGGGKMFARWLHLFPQSASALLNNPSPAIPFPWQGYFNANYQPARSASALAVPGGRVRASTHGREHLLGNVEVAHEHDGLVLRDRASGQPLPLTDLGLEAPETRTPAMHVLWLLGVPYVSVEALLPEGGGWQELTGGIWHRPRQDKGRVVFARAAWLVEQACWQRWLTAGGQGPTFFSIVRDVGCHLGAPRHIVANLTGQQPRHFDQDSPLSMLLFQKMLRQGTGNLHLTEFLPVPDAVAQEFAVDPILADP